MTTAYKIIYTGFTALVAGVSLGVILAPKYNEDTKQKMKETAENIRKRIRGFVTRSGYNVDDVVNMLKDDVQGLNPDLRNRILQMIEYSQKKMY